MLTLQRSAGNRAVGQLARTHPPQLGGRPVANGGTRLIQRVLAHDTPIAPDEVTKVRQVPDKLVFILSGKAKDEVVVKFESMGSEPKKEYGDRSAALRWLAAQVLQSVPKSAELSRDDMLAIAKIPATAVSAKGTDLAVLQTSTKGALDGDKEMVNLFPLKLESIDVGANLLKAAGLDSQKRRQQQPQYKYEPTGDRSYKQTGTDTPPPRPKAVTGITHNSPLWNEFGKMAAFDMLVSNTDRFHLSGVNLENVDFKLGTEEGVSLDIVDPTTHLTVADVTWKEIDIYKKPDEWAEKTVKWMLPVLSIGESSGILWALPEFLKGFAAAKTAFDSMQADLRRKVLSLSKDPGAAAPYKVIVRRLNEAKR